MININGSSIIDSLGTIIWLYASGGPNSPNYGSPCINASANGNYYAFSDSLWGIVAGFKGPNDTMFVDTTLFRFNAGINANCWGQQSMNVYSNIVEGEENCALVWQECESDTGPSIINYTRLRYNNNLLNYYIPNLA
jgi:hypothetical protein